MFEVGDILRHRELRNWVCVIVQITSEDIYAKTSKGDFLLDFENYVLVVGKWVKIPNTAWSRRRYEL